MANLDLLWDQIDTIIAAEDAKTDNESREAIALWTNPDDCRHSCVHGGMVTGLVCCKCGGEPR